MIGGAANRKGVMDEEIDSLYKNSTRELVNLPKGKKGIRFEWVLTKKQDPFSQEVRYKGRLVAKGYALQEGIDYNKVFSQVVKHYSICILLTLVT